MNMSSESRIFFRLVELFGEHRAVGYTVDSYWNEDNQLVVIVNGKEAEATLNFECCSHFEIELRESELSMLDRSINVMFDATDDDLREVVEQTIAYILNPNTEA